MDLGTHGRLFSRPDYLLMNVDDVREELEFRPVSRSLIMNEPFLNSFTRLPGSMDSFRIPIETALEWEADQPPLPQSRFIFHTAFCGSTLLANLMAGAVPSLPMREPDVLGTLANLKAAKSKLAGKPEHWSALISFTLRQMQKSWSDYPVVLKPSNWANTLIPDFLDAQPDSQTVTISMGLEDFLIANLRGGKERLSFSLDLLNHLLASNTANRCAVLEIERAGLSPTQRLLRLLTVVHESQRAWLKRYVHNGEWLTLSELRSSPISTLHTAADALQLKLAPDRITPTMKRELSRNAKAPNKPFSQRAEAAENTRLYVEFGDELNQVLDWRRTEQRDVG